MSRELSLSITVDCDPARPLGGADKVPELALLLEADGSCRISARERRRNALDYPESVRFFRDFVWRQVRGQGAPVVGDPRKVAELATRLRPWLARVHAGHSLAPRGAILLGALTPDAEEASRRIQHMINAADWTAAAA